MCQNLDALDYRPRVGHQRLNCDSWLRVCLTGALVFVLTLIPCHVYTHGQELSGVEASQICSIMDAYLANAEALVSGDVLVRTKYTFDSIGRSDSFNKDGVLSHSVKDQRFAFDYRNSNFCLLEEETITVTDLSKSNTPDDVAVTTSRRRASVAGEGETIARREFPGPAKEYTRRDAQWSRGGIPQFLELPDFRGFGTAVGFSWQTLDTAKTNVNRFRDGGQLVRHSIAGGNRVELVFDIKPGVGQPDSIGGAIVYTYDLVDLVPLKKELLHSVRGKLVTIGGPLFFRWDERNAVMVGKSANYSDMRSEEISGRRQRGERSIEVQLSWISVNEPLDSSCFDGSRFETNENFEEFLRPIEVPGNSGTKR